jgi:hypothetical protein
VLLAEGLGVESYLEVGGRGNFAGDSRTIRLFADFARRARDVACVWEALGCARLVVHGPEIEAVRRRLNARCGLREAEGRLFGTG